jgi:hypothetical protein
METMRLIFATTTLQWLSMPPGGLIPGLVANYPEKGFAQPANQQLHLDTNNGKWY